MVLLRKIFATIYFFVAHLNECKDSQFIKEIALSVLPFLRSAAELHQAEAKDKKTREREAKHNSLEFICSKSRR